MLRVMIRSWRDADAEELFRTGRNKRWATIKAAALRKLDMLDAAAVLSDLASPPGNRLEALQGDHAGAHSIRINDRRTPACASARRRMCFVWTDAGPEGVEITDYH